MKEGEQKGRCGEQEACGSGFSLVSGIGAMRVQSKHQVFGTKTKQDTEFEEMKDFHLTE